MTLEEIEAEIKAHGERLQWLYDVRRGPYVEPVLHMVSGTTEPARSRTLVGAFGDEECDDDEYWGRLAGVSVGGAFISTDDWRCDPRNPEAEPRIRRQAERERQRQEAAELKRKRDEATKKAQAETLVALFDGEHQVSDWVPFAEGKLPIEEKHVHGAKSSSPATTLRLRPQGKRTVLPGGITTVQKHTVTTFTVAWRTMW